MCLLGDAGILKTGQCTGDGYRACFIAKNQISKNLSLSADAGGDIFLFYFHFIKI